MEKLVTIILALLISGIFDANINIEKLTNLKCNELGLTTFEVEGTSKDSLNEDFIFNLKLKEYNAYCIIPATIPSANNTLTPNDTTPSIGTTIQSTSTTKLNPSSTNSSESSTILLPITSSESPIDTSQTADLTLLPSINTILSSNIDNPSSNNSSPLTNSTTLTTSSIILTSTIIIPSSNDNINSVSSSILQKNPTIQTANTNNLSLSSTAAKASSTLLYSGNNSQSQSVTNLSQNSSSPSTSHILSTNTNIQSQTATNASHNTIFSLLNSTNLISSNNISSTNNNIISQISTNPSLFTNSSTQSSSITSLLEGSTKLFQNTSILSQSTNIESTTTILSTSTTSQSVSSTLISTTPTLLQGTTNSIINSSKLSKNTNIPSLNSDISSQSKTINTEKSTTLSTSTNIPGVSSTLLPSSSTKPSGSSPILSSSTTISSQSKTINSEKSTTLSSSTTIPGVTSTNLSASSTLLSPRTTISSLSTTIPISSSSTLISNTNILPTSINTLSTRTTTLSQHTILSTKISSTTTKKIRLLSDSSLKGYCQISGNIKYTETLNNTDINSTQNITFNNNLQINLTECSDFEQDNFNANISFRQLNKFYYDENKTLINFYFYGMLANSLRKGYQILIDVFLIQNGFQDNKPTTAICLLTDDIDNINKPVQGIFKCTILNVTERTSSFIYHSSKYISGVPTDKVLLNPILTQQYISKGLLEDYSLGNGTSTKILPIFQPLFINFTDCTDSGQFTLIGNLSSKLENFIQFELPLAYPNNSIVICNIENSEPKSNVEMKCKTKGSISNEKIKISQISIFDNKKEELLIIEKYESSNEINCANSKLKIKEYPVIFRQVNKFKINNNKFSFFFAGLSPIRLKKGEIIKMLVVLVKEEKRGDESIIVKKNQKEIKCELNSDVIPFNGGYVQADFTCEGELKNEEDADSIEIISSNDITGINDKLEDYQKNPKLTEEEIEKTKNDKGIGKVIDYSLQENKFENLPIIQILSISKNKCADKGKIQFKAKFNEDMNQKLNFEIPLSYPSSIIKCNSPKAKANKEVFIDCKVKKEFNKANQIFIEPLIIRKKNKELLFVNKTNLSSSDLGDNKEINCIDYNQKQLEIANQKYNSKYTFVQTNNFILTDNIILFNFIIYSLSGYHNWIPLKITINKGNSILRNLEEIDEKEINCSRIDSDILGNYNCTIPNININNKSEIESFIIESDDISGLFDLNTNPIETDESIHNGKINNFSDPKYIIPLLNNTQLMSDNEKCEKDGVFNLNGTLIRKGVIEKGENVEINFINPPDSGAICSIPITKINSNMIIECQNKDYFENENVIIGTQMIGDKFLFDKTQSNDSISCAISSYSFIKENPVENSVNITNTYFNKKNSSKGLTGGAITAIVLISLAILIGIGVLIALIKNGVILSSKQTNDKIIPPISSSSANII